ncbi:S8 family peptidase [Diplocloster agilis]|uniref:S8 family peptidase n=1 Tax=Diplocloster agilis TaxID=2850323 RepID=A0A949JX58_9FIRM|nr:S8 family peptidase [Suonthocola fibrivorans]MBU9735372.1 S8 family peptidase [Diplocloster agilis]MBU9743414.1 S8 family peptidase [Diplocloster agilis]MCU6733900.1 S8 family peptidase [Suonthocola fibrivorans]SCJ14479.1 Serine protease AprX [uncultured Clostridium sp.]
MNRVRNLLGCESAYKQHILGQGIGVAILDTGVNPHPDLQGRIMGFYDVLHQKTRPYDDNGHGTHVAGIIGGSGQASKGRYMGIAPECQLISIKVLDHKGNGNSKDVLTALDWVIAHKEEYNIRIINISVGTKPKEGTGEESALVRGVDRAWDNGLVVCVAAGNNGPKPQSITTPGISRKVITIGSSDDQQYVDVFGNRRYNYSGRGPTMSCVKKPDVVAPGSNIVSCNAACVRRGRPFYSSKSGTSMATPVVSGCIALLLSKYPDMTNVEVKLRLREYSEDLGLAREQQGWGLIQVDRLLQI